MNQRIRAPAFTTNKSLPVHNSCKFQEDVMKEKTTCEISWQWNYSDAIWTSLCLKWPDIRLFLQQFIQANVKENIKASVQASVKENIYQSSVLLTPYEGKSTGDRWFPSQRVDNADFCFHSMTLWGVLNSFTMIFKHFNYLAQWSHVQLMENRDIKVSQSNGWRGVNCHYNNKIQW